VDVGAWLRGLGLGQYERAFRDHDVDAWILPGLTADDLKEIGVASVGHRRLMLQAIAALSAAAAPVDPGTGAASAAPAPAAHPPPRAERRQLTVMFADLVGSTALSARLDPEELHDVLRAYQDAVAGTVARFGGHIAKFMGDGVLAYFGWPQAHEDDAEHAVRAGLALLDAVAKLRTPGGETLAARVGIATGLVVVGDLLGEGASREETVVGETPNLAARLQTIAAPGTMVVAEGTRRLLGAAFALEALGPRSLKGLGEAVPAFRVRGERPVRSRFEARQTSAVLSLVGRKPELALLLERWRLARMGQGQAVLLTGEPGLGKSRLAEALAEALVGEPHAAIRCQCSPQHADSPLWPVTEQLGRTAGFAPGDDDAVRLGKLEALLRPGGGDAAEAAALIAPLLGIEPAGHHPILDLTPRQRRARTLAALVDHLASLAAGHPALVLFEDVHWIDPTSHELVEHLLERIAGLRILLLLTSRPEDQPPLGDSPRLTRLVLERLSREASSAIIREVGRGKPLPPDLAEEIARRADGVPLFVEELTKAVLETGELRETEGGWELGGVLPAGAIPSSLQASLMARLDRLAPVKQVAQVAACIGREFDRALLAAAMPLPAAELDAAIERLLASGLASRRGGAADGTYAFKHALVRDAAYASMLNSRRRQVHADIAAALETQFPEIAATQPEVVARHCERAGRMEHAVEYWRRAGKLAGARSAAAEAATHLGRAVRCLAVLPPTRERQMREFELQAELGPALIHVKGYAAPETGRAWARARELCRELDLVDRIGPVLFGRYVFHYVRAEFEPARAAARELLEHGRRHDDPAARLVGMRSLGVICLSTGEFATGRQHLEAALEGLRRLDERPLALAYGQDLRATGLLWLAKILLAQGFPERALAAGEAGLRRSEALGHPNTRAFTLCHAAKLTALTGDARGTVPLADATVQLATEQGYAQWLAEAWTFRGWARAELGELEAGLAELDQGARAYRASGAVHWRGTHLGLRGRVLALQGRLGEAREVLAEALMHARCTGERWFEAELERLRGEVLAGEGRAEEAEVSFSRAMSVARSQGAKLWELRAATGLARTKLARGEAREAHELLAPVHGWFTEGFDMPDLKRAEALLKKLASEPLGLRPKP
jgi:class 3 adenylate cyclase/predicted ATPase